MKPINGSPLVQEEERNGKTSGKMNGITEEMMNKAIFFKTRDINLKIELALDIGDPEFLRSEILGKYDPRTLLDPVCNAIENSSKKSTLECIRELNESFKRIYIHERVKGLRTAIFAERLDVIKYYLDDIEADLQEKIRISLDWAIEAQSLIVIKFIAKTVLIDLSQLFQNIIAYKNMNADIDNFIGYIFRLHKEIYRFIGSEYSEDEFLHLEIRSQYIYGFGYELLVKRRNAVK